MLTLKIIAILGIVLGAVSLVTDYKKNGRKSLGVFICLIIASAALLAISFVAEDHIRALNANGATETVATQTQTQNNEADALDPAIVLDLSDPSVPDDPEYSGNPGNQANDTVNANAEAPENNTGDDANAEAPENNTGDGTNAEAPENDTGDGTNAKAPENNTGDDTNAEANEIVAETENPENNEPGAENTENNEPDAGATTEEDDPLAPTADAGPDVNSAKVNEPITFSGLKSKKKKASLKKFEWDFGDGTNADGKEVKHAYKAAGTYTATLTVTDKDGHSGKTTRTIHVNRPESKARFVHQNLTDVIDSGAKLPALSGTTTKSFDGSQMFLDAAGNVSSSENCECTLTVSLKGPGCDATKSKTIKNGGEGDVSVKAVCKGELGEYTWSVERIAAGSCGCSWVDIKADGYEN